MVMNGTSASMKLSIFWRKSMIRYIVRKVIRQIDKNLKNSLQKYLERIFMAYNISDE